MSQQGDYRINYEPLFGPLQLIDVPEAIQGADHPWYNQSLIESRRVLLRLGVFAGGEYHWHKHRPVALEPTQVLMIEKAGVAVTGD